MSVKHIVAVSDAAGGSVEGVDGEGAGAKPSGTGGVESDLLKVPLKLKNHKTDDGTPVLRRQTWQGDGEFTGWRKHEYKLITPEVYYVPSGAGELVEQVRYQLQDFPVLVHYFVMGNARTNRAKRQKVERTPGPSKRARQRVADEESADETSSAGASGNSYGGGVGFVDGEPPVGGTYPPSANHPYGNVDYYGGSSLPPEMQPPMSLPECPPSPARLSIDPRETTLSGHSSRASTPRQSPPVASPPSLWSSLFGTDQSLSSTGATAVDTGPDLTDALASRAFSMDDPLNLNLFSSTDSLVLRSSTSTADMDMAGGSLTSSSSVAAAAARPAARSSASAGGGAGSQSLLAPNGRSPELSVVSYAPDTSPSDASTTIILVMQGVPLSFTLTARFESTPNLQVAVTRLGDGVFQLVAPVPPAPCVTHFFVAAKPASSRSQAQPLCTAQLPFFFTPSDEKGHLSLGFREMRGGVPSLWVEKFRRTTRELDVSSNDLSNLDWLAPLAPQLTSFVADSNHLSDNVVWPPLPHLRVLSLNRNQFSDLNALLDSLEESCPQLQYLSLVGNGCCPFFSDAYRGTYRLYRLTVIRRLPHLRDLDSSKVSPEERQEAGVA
jgi:hypothetical protein